MSYNLIKEGKFSYYMAGKGQPMLLLHGLMGTLSNFKGILDYFPKKGYQVIILQLPIYTLSLLKTNIINLSKFLDEFIIFKNFESPILLGNSLGGHIALYYTHHNKKHIKALVLTGSSGLYEKSMGDTYPKRRNFDYIKKKTEHVFYNPKIATPEIVNEVFKVVNDRSKALRTLAIAKSAIRHNMAKDLPSIKTPTCLIWGKDDNVTPCEVANEFNQLLSNSELFWIEKCGHAPMMEHPKIFNSILEDWLVRKGY